MRLDKQEEKAVFEAISGIPGEVFLFGSRVDDSKKGGDIDLLIFSKEKSFHLSRKISTRFFMNCEEKIDVIVMYTDNLSL